MVNIIPFKGIRPCKEIVSDVASVPYDVLSSEEARNIVATNPKSFLKIIKPEVDLDKNINLYDDIVYETGAKNLRDFITKNILRQDQKPCFYIYRQQMGNHTQTGLVAAASVDDYVKNTIKKHEHTREEKETDRTRHIDALNANTGPVFLTYNHNNDIDSIIKDICQENPEYNFTASDDVKHTFWVVEDMDKISSISNAFQKIKALYVADGHHRSAAALRVSDKRKNANPAHFGKEAYNYFLTVIFPDNQMQILPYNRIIKDLNGLDSSEVLDKLGKIFTISPTTEATPTKKHCFCMYIQKQWHHLEAKSEIIVENDPVKSLDVYILQEYVLSPLFNIKNPRKDTRIEFVGGIRGTKALEEKTQKGVAFSLYPVNIQSLMAIADAGEVMPPKSTWFEPKLRSGIVINPLS